MDTLAPVTYRGMRLSDVTSAGVFRTIDRYKPCLFLDESEKYQRRERAEIQNILCSGYKRGYPVLRLTGEDYEPRPFEVYGQKCFASTLGLSETLEDRCIDTIMVRRTRDLNREIDQEEALEIRNQLLYWRWQTLQNAFQLEKIPYNLDVLMLFSFFPKVSSPELESIEDRLWELFAPLVSANTGKVKAEVVEYAHKRSIMVREIEQETREARIMRAILSAIHNLTDEDRRKRFVATKSIEAFYNADENSPDMLNVKEVGWTLRKIGFHIPKSNGKQWGRVIDPELLRRLCKQYTLPYPEGWELPKPVTIMDVIRDDPESLYGKETGE
jgi:hypothetical protein